ncbi:MAG: 30S ribosomal protein S18 [Planctomycetota bacterium]|jgi:small subunit ribosomal protein S18
MKTGKARNRKDRKDKKKKFKRFRPRACRFTRMRVEFVDWKDVPTLQRLCTGQGKVLGRKRSGTSARFQRKVKTAIKRARFMGLLPYVGT